MTSLYQLTGERLALQSKLEAMDFDQETIADTLEGDSTEIEAKITNYGFVIRNRSSFADSIQAEITRLQDRLEKELKRVAYIENYLLTNMVVCKITKIECPAFTISVSKNNPKVIVDDEKAIPANYLTVHDPIPTPPPSPDKKAIAKAIKEGKEVAGCHMEQGNRLTIK